MQNIGGWDGMNETCGKKEPIGTYCMDKINSTDIVYDAAAVGELLIDFTPSGISEQGGMLFERNPGGAPANVLAAMAKLGLRTAFIGKVGLDPFGAFLKDVLEKQAIDTKGLLQTEEAKTTLAFVHLDETGDRTFSFYRNPGADMLLTEEEVKEEILRKASIFHFGSVSMSREPARGATLKAAEKARSMGKLVSYDPNLRPPLWENLAEAKNIILQGLQYTDIFKISEEELVFLTETNDLEYGTSQLYEHYKTPVILVTLGAKGCFYRRKEQTNLCPGFHVDAIDTTGAGDAFLGGFLYKLIMSGKQTNELTNVDLNEMVRFANAMGALTTTRKGAIPAIPTLEETISLLIRV
jgi:fructokinase